MNSQPVQPELVGIPETMLWPLWNRSVETSRPDRLINDPWSESLVSQIDYDFEASFGKPSVFHGIRSRVCDDLIREFIRKHGRTATIVALGEGLDCQRLRVGEHGVRWISVDVEEALHLRSKLLEGVCKEKLVPCSATDHTWMDKVGDDGPVFITALGLLMYFDPDDVRELLTAIGQRFSGGEMFFDIIPQYFSKKTVRGLQVTKNYQAPPMPWGISVDEAPDFVASTGLETISVQTYADPFPERTRLYWLLSKIGPVRRALAGGLVHACIPGSA